MKTSVPNSKSTDCTWTCPQHFERRPQIFSEAKCWTNHTTHGDNNQQ